MNTADRARDEAAAWGEILVLCEQLVNLRMPQGPDNSSQLTPAAPSPPDLEGSLPQRLPCLPSLYPSARV
jgi:hypothetical protein